MLDSAGNVEKALAQTLLSLGMALNLYMKMEQWI